MTMRAGALLLFVGMVGSCHADRHAGAETGGGLDAMEVALQDVASEGGADVGPRPDAAAEMDHPADAGADGDPGSGGCPVEPPIGEACVQDGLRCQYGTECCCGQCYPSLVCDCHGGQFGCYYTDACLIPGCPDVVEVGDPGTLDAADPGSRDDAGQAIACDASPPVFPEFDESCKQDQDCVVVFHQVNCCGTEVALGIAMSAQDGFRQAEEVCRSQYPGCGCPAFATEAEDGNTAWDPAQFAVKCKAGECFSYVVGAAPRCHDADECEDGQTCLAPGEPMPCGICRQPEEVCEKDQDCGPAEVCEWVTGACLCQPAMQCVMRCDLPLGSPLPPCKQGEDCVDGHCVAPACVTDTDCPRLFWCDPTHETCTRRTCETDADCEGGRCVKGACYDSLGTCSYIPP